MAQIIVDKDVTEEIAIHVMTTVAKKYAQRELSKAQCKVEKDRVKDAGVKKIKGEAKAKEGNEKPKKGKKKTGTGEEPKGQAEAQPPGEEQPKAKRENPATKLKRERDEALKALKKAREDFQRQLQKAREDLPSGSPSVVTPASPMVQSLPSAPPSDEGPASPKPPPKPRDTALAAVPPKAAAPETSAAAKAGGSQIGQVDEVKDDGRTIASAPASAADPARQGAAEAGTPPQTKPRSALRVRWSEEVGHRFQAAPPTPPKATTQAGQSRASASGNQESSHNFMDWMNESW